MTQAHAKAIAETVSDAQADLASKGDLQLAVAGLESRLSALETRLTWRLAIVAGAVVAAMKLIP